MAANKKKDALELIVDTIATKSTMKQEVYRGTRSAFDLLEKTMFELLDELQAKLSKMGVDIPLECRCMNEFQCEFRVAGDVLIFHMHSNVFQFDRSHTVWKTSYLDQDESRSYCGIINVYNFLSDSFTYERLNDAGYMIARIFVNRENHFMVEGKRQMGFLYNDFVNSVLTAEVMRKVVESIILYTLDFDLLAPSYEHVKEISVMDVQELTKNMNMRTGKRLGFKFQADNESFE